MTSLECAEAAASREGRPFANGRTAGATIEPKRGHILVVDDDEDVRDAVGAALEDAGYSVTLAHHGADALIKLSQMSLPSLILLDLAMPELAGQDFLREILHDPTFSHVPVVVVSGTALAPEAVGSMGADGYLRKPVTADDLLRAVASALGDWDDDAVAPTEREPTRHD